MLDAAVSRRRGVGPASHDRADVPHGRTSGLEVRYGFRHEVALGPLNGVTEEALQAAWESGPLATFRLMKLCYPHLKGDGCIINLASTAAFRWDASNYGAYAAVKEAIRALSRGAACEWAMECEADVGRFVAQLCGDASSYINGQTIAVDGGQAYLG